MSQFINQANIGIYQEKTSYLVKYSSIWFGIIGTFELYLCYEAIMFTINYSKVASYLPNYYYYIMLAHYGLLFVRTILVVVAFFKVVPLYSSYVDQNNAIQYKSACSCAGMVYLFFMVISLLEAGMFYALAEISIDVGAGKYSTSGLANAGRLVVIVALVIYYIIPVSFNLWLYCLYRNKAKPLTEFYTNASLNSGYNGDPQMAASFTGAPGQAGYVAPQNGGYGAPNQGNMGKPQQGQYY